MSEYLKISGLKKMFGKKWVLDGVNFSIKEKEIVSIIGPSGGGKTTLLRLIAGLEKPDEGSIVFPKENPHIGIVFQDFNLWPHKTVLENIIEAPILVKKVQKKKAVKDAEELLKSVGLSHKANSHPFQLSGGEQQRAAIARSLAMHPKMILLDEITSNLDPKRIEEINKIIKKLANNGFTMLIVSHDLTFVQEISNKVLFLDNGKILERTRPKQIFTKPQKNRII